MITTTLEGVQKTEKWLKKQKQESEKAMNDAVRVEGFSMMKALKKEIKAGNPGGRRFDPLSSIALRGLKRRGGGFRGSKATSALKRLQFGVEYKVKEAPFNLKFGFLNRTGIKGFFRSLAKEHQTGGTRQVTQEQRQAIIQKGASLLGWRKKGGKTGYSTAYGKNTEAMNAEGRSPFFLKKSTTSFRSPARPIIDPFWTVHVSQARENIRKNFRAKLAGKRI